MKTPFNLTERFGHIDLFFIGSCRVSLLPEPPPSIFETSAHTCGEGCDHDHEEEAHAEEPEEAKEESSSEPPTYVYKKFFVRQGLRTHLIDIPPELKVSGEAFIRVFTAPYEDVPQFIATGTEEEQWLVEMREEYLGTLDPEPKTEE